MIAPLAAVVLAATMTVPPAAEVKPCRDPIVQVIKAAGWKGRDVRTAYAISWRESNHRPGVGNAAAGLFQLQWSVWSGTRYWPANPYDAQQNATAAHAIWKRLGWRPWGITADGTGIDARDYSGWDSGTQWALIWRPYAVGLEKWNRLPKGCRA